MLNKSLLVLAIVAVVGCSTVNQLLTEKPEWLHACQRSDPRLDDCLLTFFRRIFPRLAKGIPEIGVEPYEPLNIRRVSVSKDSGAVTLSGTFNDLVVYGPSNATPTYSELDLPRRRLNFGLDIPSLDVRAAYNLRGKVLLLPLVGNGAAELQLTGVQTRVSCRIDLVPRHGREVILVEKMRVAFTLSGLKMHFQNLFNGNKVLGRTVNAFLNQHALEIVDELNENIGSSLADIFKDLTNQLFNNLPTDLWLLKDDQMKKEENTKEEKKEEKKEEIKKDDKIEKEKSS